MKNKKIIIIFVMLISFGVISIVIINNFEYKQTPKRPNLSKKAYYLQEYLKKNKNDTDTLLELGLTYSNNNELAKAEETYLKLININNNIPIAWQRLGNVYVSMSKFDKAAAAYEKTIKLEPNNPSAYFLLSQVLLLWDIDKAKDIGKKCIYLSKSTQDNWQYMQDYYNLINQLGTEGLPENTYKIYFNLINDDFISSDELKLALIDYSISLYPNDKSDYKNKLLAIKAQLQK
ncbi:hypothetical protein Z968_11710 [Clostridium novyi A str. 4552]|uniref:Uncharacterized protein n=1 Tax=Clostridium novyi A str. 4552 TaxID=1444289 RepID=A0A0A0I433_CLONO|nr:tetratricopeptide repeat protein [Clostridium novyi]KGM94460.1 hypothetical protein Z968_11710 [Clostridium novyi A str. 4552]